MKLQFKASGAKKFKTVRTIAAGGDASSTKVTVKRSGSFRLAYRGDDQSAASISGAAKVTVKP